VKLAFNLKEFRAKQLAEAQQIGRASRPSVTLRRAPNGAIEVLHHTYRWTPPPEIITFKE
jgi:hypothetical protein